MIVFDHAVPAIWIVLTVVAALGLGGFTFWRWVPRRLINGILPLLYLLTILLFVWCLLMPGSRDSVTRLLKPRFIVLLDTSASMALTPGEDVPSRWSVARTVLDQPWTSLVGSECEIDVYPLAESVGDRLPLVEAVDLQTEGTSTLLREALEQITERSAGLNVAGALLLSDGMDTREAFDDWAAESRPFPIHTVRLQPDAAWQAEPDLRIDGVQTPRRVTVDWTTDMKILVAGQGTGGKPVNVLLHRDNVLVRQKPVQIPAEGGEREVVFDLKHEEVGLFDYRVSIPPMAGETSTNDNVYEVSIQVSDARNRLLYVEGVPRWEYKFLKRALLANKQISPIIFYTGADGAPRGGTPTGSMTADMRQDQLAFFKIVVLGNLDAEELTEGRAESLVKFVEDGGSLVVLGGVSGWSSGGLVETGLKKMLPVRIKGAKLLESEEAFPVALTDVARSHPAFAGDPELWANIPPVQSVFSGVEASPAAQVLVEANTPNGMLPVVVSHRYGQGKVTTISTDALWNWQLSPEGVRNKPYQRFWAQMVSWLLPDEGEVEQGRVELAADRDRLFLGESVTLTARVGDTQEGTMQALVTLPDGGEVPYPMLPGGAPGGGDDQSFVLSSDVDQPGLHRIRAVWRAGGVSRESEPVSFFVKSFSPESVPRPINKAVLEAVSVSSGGRFHETVEELDQTLSSITTRAVEESSAEYYTLWRTPLMISLLMLLLTVTWLTRKLRNMP